MTSLWAQWHLKSPASWSFTQPFVQEEIKENIKAPCHWLLWGEFTSEFPAQMASNAKKISIWWRHHAEAKACNSLSTGLTHYGLVKPYGDIYLGQYWFREWLVVWWHQAITWAIDDWLSMRSSGFHKREISQEMLKIFTLDMNLKITNLKDYSCISRSQWVNSLRLSDACMHQ